MKQAGERQADAWRAGLAIGAAVEAVIRVRAPWSRQVVSDDDKRNLALAVAMGVLHGCCGPNGDFTDAQRRAAWVARKRLVG